MQILLEFATEKEARKWIRRYEITGGPRKLNVRKVNNGKYAVIDPE